MIKHTFKDISTGGGFNHYWITYPEYGIGVLVNDENGGALPKEGKRFDIGVYKLDFDFLDDGSACIGDHFEDSFNTLDNFSHAQIVARAFGYCEGLGLVKKQKSIKKFLCVWNDDIFEVHDLLSLYQGYKNTNLYSEEFSEEWGGDTIDQLLDVMALDQKITFDNMTVMRVR